MNTLITGHIYHVIDKTTGEIVKVGSTVRTLEKRWGAYNKKKYSNHFLKLVREIKSSEFDLYNPEDLRCPFHWHLVAAEHFEIFKVGTWRKGPLSNLLSPLMQKCRGFDTIETVRAGGSIGGILTRDKKIGLYGVNFNRIEASRKGGLKNIESGHLRSISSAGGKVSGVIQGRKNAESGRMKEVQKMGLGKGGKIGGPKGMHIRWHINRGLVSSDCKHCAQV